MDAKITTAVMPEILRDTLLQGSKTRAHTREHYNNEYINTENRGGGNPSSITNDNIHNNHNISFDDGSRDESLFHALNCLLRGGMDVDNALKIGKILASNCNPPFPEKKVIEKIQSAQKRQKNKKRNLTAELREWINITWDNISITDALQNITNITNEDRPKITVIMNRFVKEGLLERVPGRNGIYRKVDNTCEALNFLESDTGGVPLWLPFGLGDLVEIMAGNIILVMGDPNAGKTALLLNIVKENMVDFDIHYFNSEMGGGELKKRLSKFKDVSLSQWRFHAWERVDGFQDVIKSGEGVINVIDFLELYDNFYEISGKLAAIHKKLNGALAFVAIQKNPGADVGLGGYRSLEKPRLALAMSNGRLKIVKAKNWSGQQNPNGKEIEFKIADGCRFIPYGGWKKTT